MIPESSKARTVVCPGCGTKIEVARFCEGCGKKLAPGAKFCGDCGAKVS